MLFGLLAGHDYSGHDRCGGDFLRAGERGTGDQRQRRRHFGFSGERGGTGNRIGCFHGRIRIRIVAAGLIHRLCGGCIPSRLSATPEESVRHRCNTAALGVTSSVGSASVTASAGIDSHLLSRVGSRIGLSGRSKRDRFRLARWFFSNRRPHSGRRFGLGRW